MLPLLLGLVLGNLPVATVVPRHAGGGEAPAIAVAQTHGCDDGASGGTLVQRGDHYYGNAFAVGCARARLMAATFTYHGHGLAGPYAFRLHLVDPACGATGVTPTLTVPGAPGGYATAEIDLASLGWCVGPEFLLLLEPLACAAAEDCFPALAVDASSEPVSTHCAVVSVPGSIARECRQARSSDGRGFDFRLRVAVDCGAPGCTTAVQAGTWGQVKRLFE